jgi:hypothetical protein
LIGAAGEVLDDLLGYVKRPPKRMACRIGRLGCATALSGRSHPRWPTTGSVAADIAGDGDTALELLSINTYDIAVLDRDTPGPSGDEIAKRGL